MTFVLPLPVTPSRTCWVSPDWTPLTSCSMASGWSPAGLKGASTRKREVTGHLILRRTDVRKGGANPLRGTSPRGGEARRNRVDASIVAPHDLPIALMHHPVMPVTQEDQVRKIGRPPMNPVHDVMRRSPARRPITTWPRAATVANLESFALRARDHSLGATNVDDHRLGVEQYPRDRAVASQSLDRFR